MQQDRPPINLMRGWPNPSLLPVSLIKSAAQAALSSPSIATKALLYGPDPGYEPAREAIASWLSHFYSPADSIAAERTCITGGASQNLGCILSVYTNVETTRKIWIVAPAYYLAFGIFADAGFGAKMRAVPEDEGGVDLAFLEREMQRCEEVGATAGKDEDEGVRGKRARERGKVYKHVIYCVPTFANPSSRTMTLERRQGLVRLARRFDALVVADDVYDFLQWPVDDGSAMGGHLPHTALLPRLVDIDRELDGGAEREGADGFGNACSNGSFSKIAGPGIRCGWVEGTKKFAYGVSQTGTTRSGGAPSQLTSTYVTHLLTTGQLQHHIQTVLQPAYASRYATLMRAIEAQLLPLGFTLPQADRDIVGGYFVWLGLPAGLTAPELAHVCREEYGVIVASGEMFEVPGDNAEVNFPRNVRLCFAWEDEWKLKEGIEGMARAAQKLVTEAKIGNGEYVMVESVDVDSFK